MVAVSAALNTMGVPLSAQQACPEDVRVPADAEGIIGQDVEFAGEASRLFGYLVKPKRDSMDPLPAVLVIHENRGLVEHIRDVTRRTAKGGFIALGIDLLSRAGGTAQFTDPQEQARAYNSVPAAARLADLRSAAAYLRTLPEVRADRIGTVGFCAGGGNVWALATSGEDMQASVVYYGAPVATAEQIENLKGPVLCHYAELDRNLTASAAPAITTLVQRNKRFAFHVHWGVGHAFNNDTGAAYNRATACEAWAKTLDFFNLHLNRE
ncbi:MAG: dienelactone hydrolase family protein [Acidobacteria bacterium]|nr:dienelactone hydrolase family protein [Acidobacteriota bacterium]